jgi:hypothetical protein
MQNDSMAAVRKIYFAFGLMEININYWSQAREIWYGNKGYVKIVHEIFFVSGQLKIWRL